ncbi:MAG: VirB3 family type IV secretion system protein [Deltaproteobacteria bacterium]|nr:VirB3 family type IV secretion system protein [Deltaproteobacteria bacterium]
MSNNNDEPPEGYQIPVYRSLQEPVLLVGIPRAFAFILWPPVIGLAFGMREPWVLIPGLVLHGAFVALTRWDPLWYEILLRAIDSKKLEP